MEKHFELTDRFIVNESGVKLFQIKCTRDIKWAKVGDLGGWIESKRSLSDNAWVYGDAWVYGNARVLGNAWVFDNARVFGDAGVSGNAHVSGNAQVFGNDQHCGFDYFGSQNRHTHAYMTKSGEVEIT